MKVSMRSWPLFIVAALAGMAPACSLEKEQALRELKSPKAAIRARAVGFPSSSWLSSLTATSRCIDTCRARYTSPIPPRPSSSSSSYRSWTTSPIRA